MKRFVVAAITAVTVATATMGTAAAHEHAEGGLNRAQGINEAATHRIGPAESGNITLTDLIVTSRPPDPGGNN